MEQKLNHGKGLRVLISSLFPSFRLLRKNDPLRLAGATAFFTSFALPPIVFILIQLIGSFAGRKAVGEVFIQRIADTLGEGGATQVRQVLRNIGGFSENLWVMAIVFVFLIFIATTLFSIIRNSIHDIWQIKVDEKPGIGYLLRTRARSIGLIGIAGLLFLADMLMESIKMVAGDYLEIAWKPAAVYLNGIISEVAGLIVICSWFILIFRFLGDGRPRWRAAIAAGILTGLLFKIGKVILWALLINNDVGQLYGRSGSLVLILLFVFYSSFIFYFGASYVRVYSEKMGLPIKTVHKAYHYKTLHLADNEAEQN